MSYIFSFTLTCKKDNFNVGQTIFSDKGDIIGRILHKSKLKSTDDNTCFYDVESSKENFELIKSKKLKLFGLEDYCVYECTTAYTNE